MFGMGWATLYTTIIERYEICQTQTTIHEVEKK
jgi:hypothetical protein